MILRIKNLEADAIIGVYGWEKEANRKLYFNVEIDFDASKAAQSDDIKDTLDYDNISQTIITETAKTRFDLIEKLCSHLLNIIMQDERILSAKLEIDKPGAVKEAESVSVFEERKR